jgi:LuxR family maltose regulon positive regulatory protein
LGDSNLSISYGPTSVNGVIELVTGSTSLQDVCRRIVHSDLAAGQLQGAQILVLDQRSNLFVTATYGASENDEISEISAWGDSIEAEAIRTKKLTSTSQQTCLPLLKDSIPVGCLTLWHSDDSNQTPIAEPIAETLSKLVAFFIEAQTNGQISRQKPVSTGSVQDITTRQVIILELIADGLTNAEIAVKVMLSESTVRQETIRIYRALGVGSRQEAVAKGRALGLIAKITPPPSKLMT